MAERRSRKKVDLLPPEIVAAINDAIVNKRKTYREIEEWLRNDGIEISESAIQKYGKEFLAKLERISIAREQAKSIIESSSGLRTEMSEATSTVAFQLLMEMLINTDANAMDKQALSAIRTLATLERSTISREKLKLEHSKGVDAATEKITKAIHEEWKEYPDELAKILQVTNSAVEKLKTAQN